MAAQMTKGKLNLGAAIKAHASDPVEEKVEFIDLPGGITNGVAKLVEARRGQYKTGKNQGEDFLYLAGVVVEPKTAVDIKKIWKDGKVQIVSSREVKVEFQRTSVMLPLCEEVRKDGTVVTLEENVAKALNELRLLGGPECTEGVEDENDLDNLLTALVGPEKKDGPYFRFSTQWKDPNKEYPEGGVWPHKWYGTKGLENYEQAESGGTEDETVAPAKPAPKNGSATTAKGTAVATAKKTTPKQEEVSPDEVDQGDLDALVVRAGKKDAKAQTQLKDMYLAAGYSEEDFDATSDWEGVVEGIRNPKTEEEAAEETAEETEWEPKKDDVYHCSVDLKTGKTSKKSIEVEVLSVDKKANTVKVRSLVDQKTTGTVKWDQLEQPT